MLRARARDTCVARSEVARKGCVLCVLVGAAEIGILLAGVRLGSETAGSVNTGGRDVSCVDLVGGKKTCTNPRKPAEAGGRCGGRCAGVRLGSSIVDFIVNWNGDERHGDAELARTFGGRDNPGGGRCMVCGIEFVA